MPNCGKCRRTFATRRALDQHLDSPAHQPSYYCRDCDRSFGSHQALQQHLNSPIHSPSYYCSQCDVWFWTAGALSQHRTYSSAHARNVHCIGGGCRKSFHTWSAMIQHFESGACRSGMTQSLVNSIAVSVDQTHLFSLGARTIELPPEDTKRVVEVPDDEEVVGIAGAPSAATSVSGSVAVLTPATDHEPSSSQTPESGSILTPRTPVLEISGFQSPAMVLTPRTPFAENFGGVNPQALANSLERLTVRIIEIPPIYFCPIPGCVNPGKTFTSLSGLFQHMERGCRGCPNKLKKQLLKGFRRLT